MTMQAVVAVLSMITCDARASFAGAPCEALPPVSRVVVLDENSRTSRTFEAERELRAFALYSYRNVAGDIINGHGPHLEALADPFRAACADNDVLVGWLRDMLADAGSAPEFSRRIAVALAAVRGFATAPS